MSSVKTVSATQGSPFWKFSLGYYRGAGVSEACLELQDRCGVDVNLVLFLLWMASQKRLLAADQVKRLADKVRPWQTDVIGPIRSLRRMLRSEEHTSELQSRLHLVCRLLLEKKKKNKKTKTNKKKKKKKTKKKTKKKKI